MHYLYNYVLNMSYTVEPQCNDHLGTMQIAEGVRYGKKFSTVFLWITCKRFMFYNDIHGSFEGLLY